MISGAPNVLSLYRNVLRAAKHFPSKKRAGIIQGIRLEFRANKGLTDADKIQKCLATAQRGLSDLQAYLPQNSQSAEGISITLKGATN